MTFRDRLLPAIDRIRGIPGRMGLHRHRVFVRVTTYVANTRNTVGVSAVLTDVETELLVNGQPPHVKIIRSKDLVAGSPEYADTLYEIGPVTAEFAGGGVTAESINPERGANPATTQYRITGPGIPTAGILCKREDDTTDKPFRYMIRVKSIGRRKSP